MQNVTIIPFIPLKPIVLFSLTCIFLLISNTSSAQRGRSKLVKYNMEPRPGAVWTSDGTRLEGGIVFNDNDGIVMLHLKDDKEVKAFSQRTMSKFQFNGTNGNSDEVYFVLSYIDTVDGQERVGIFQVLKEFKSFAVVLKIDPLTVVVKNNTGSEDQRVGTKTRTLCFIGTDGTLSAYARYMKRESDGLLFDVETQRKRLVNSDLIEQYTGKHYPDLVEYAKSQDLGFRKLEDVMSILTYYEKLVNKE